MMCIRIQWSVLKLIKLSGFILHYYLQWRCELLYVCLFCISHSMVFMTKECCKFLMVIHHRFQSDSPCSDNCQCSQTGILAFVIFACTSNQSNLTWPSDQHLHMLTPLCNITMKGIKKSEVQHVFPVWTWKITLFLICSWLGIQFVIKCAGGNCDRKDHCMVLRHLKWCTFSGRVDALGTETQHIWIGYLDYDDLFYNVFSVLWCTGKTSFLLLSNVWLVWLVFQTVSSLYQISYRTRTSVNMPEKHGTSYLITSGWSTPGTWKWMIGNIDFRVLFVARFPPNWRHIFIWIF